MEVSAMKVRNTFLNIRINNQIKQELSNLANENDCTVSDLVNYLLQKSLKRKQTINMKRLW